MKFIALFLLCLIGFSLNDGIDVSFWQGTIDWPTVAQNIDFAFIRASHGVTEDSQFSNYWSQAQSAGVSVGPYHYYQPSDDPTAQAQAFCNYVGTLQNLPPVLDIEVNGGLDAGTLQQGITTWLNYVQNQFGVTPMIYTGVDFAETYLNSQTFASYPLWIAEYGVSSPQIQNLVWSTYSYWQYSESGSISGIGGSSVDLDVANSNQ